MTSIFLKNFTITRPNVWRPPIYKPEIIEAKARENNINNYFSPASDVLLKFKLWKMQDKPKEDFVIIEDNYSPEVIEALRRKNRV